MKMMFVAMLFLLAFASKACDDRYETVIVREARYESVYIQPVYSCGRCLYDGYYARRYVPCQYAMRPVVWVPQVYVRPYYPPPCYAYRRW